MEAVRDDSGTGSVGRRDTGGKGVSLCVWRWLAARQYTHACALCVIPAARLLPRPPVPARTGSSVLCCGMSGRGQWPHVVWSRVCVNMRGVCACVQVLGGEKLGRGGGVSRVMRVAERSVDNEG